eukprot:scaffold18678_cov128-Isochrysis_galbana.AAC.7
MAASGFSREARREGSTPTPRLAAPPPPPVRLGTPTWPPFTPPFTPLGLPRVSLGARGVRCRGPNSARRRRGGGRRAGSVDCRLTTRHVTRPGDGGKRALAMGAGKEAVAAVVSSWRERDSAAEAALSSPRRQPSRRAHRPSKLVRLRLPPRAGRIGYGCAIIRSASAVVDPDGGRRARAGPAGQRARRRIERRGALREIGDPRSGSAGAAGWA